MGIIILLEFVCKGVMLFLCYGIMCNLVDFIKLFGGLFGGLVVVVVVGIVLLVLGIDVGGLSCCLFVYIGLIGFKLM